MRQFIIEAVEPLSEEEAKKLYNEIMKDEVLKQALLKK